MRRQKPAQCIEGTEAGGGTLRPAEPPKTFNFIYLLFIMYLLNMGRVILLTLTIMSVLLCQVRLSSF